MRKNFDPFGLNDEDIQQKNIKDLERERANFAFSLSQQKPLWGTNDKFSAASFNQEFINSRKIGKGINGNMGDEGPIADIYTSGHFTDIETGNSCNISSIGYTNIDNDDDDVLNIHRNIKNDFDPALAACDYSTSKAKPSDLKKSINQHQNMKIDYNTEVIPETLKIIPNINKKNKQQELNYAQLMQNTYNQKTEKQNTNANKMINEKHTYEKQTNKESEYIKNLEFEVKKLKLQVQLAEVNEVKYKNEIHDLNKLINKLKRKIVTGNKSK